MSIVGRSKEDKKLTTYMHVYAGGGYVRDRKNGPFVFLSPPCVFLFSLARPVVGKITSHVSSLCVQCAMPPAARPGLW